MINLSGAYSNGSRGPIPGAREPGRLTRFGRPVNRISRIASEQAIPMSAATIADRQLEGGGAVSQRRPARERSRSKGVWQKLHWLLVSTRARWRPVAHEGSQYAK